jgi:hypothetical protein
MAITKYKLQTKTYKALLTQTGELSGTDISSLSWAFIVGETYNITNYVAGDDFSNIANVINGTINTTGCTFSATGKIPTDWSNGSTITSSGGLVVNELENNLGFPVGWVAAEIYGSGTYVAYNNNGFENNTFPSEKTHIFVQSKLGTNFPGEISILSGVTSAAIYDEEGAYEGMPIDDIVYLYVLDSYAGFLGGGVHNELNHVAVSIEIYP